MAKANFRTSGSVGLLGTVKGDAVLEVTSILFEIDTRFNKNFISPLKKIPFRLKCLSLKLLLLLHLLQIP